jgi:hypothetical protein
MAVVNATALAMIINLIYAKINNMQRYKIIDHYLQQKGSLFQAIIKIKENLKPYSEMSRFITEHQSQLFREKTTAEEWLKVNIKAYKSITI